MENLKGWISDQVNELSISLITSITHMKLFNNGVQVMFSKGKKLYRLKMK